MEAAKSAPMFTTSQQTKAPKTVPSAVCPDRQRPSASPQAMLLLLVALLGLAAAPRGCRGQKGPAAKAPSPAPLPAASGPSPEPSAGGLTSFVTVKDGRFQLDGREWFMTGTNIYYLAQRAADVQCAAGSRRRQQACSRSSAWGDLKTTLWVHDWSFRRWTGCFGDGWVGVNGKDHAGLSTCRPPPESAPESAPKPPLCKPNGRCVR